MRVWMRVDKLRMWKASKNTNFPFSTSLFLHKNILWPKEIFYVFVRIVYKDIFSFECLKRDVHFCLFPPMKGFIYHSPGSKLVLIAKLFVECFGSWLSRLCSLYADNLYLHIMSSFCIEWKWSIKPNKLFEWMTINCTMK